MNPMSAGECPIRGRQRGVPGAMHDVLNFAREPIVPGQPLVAGTVALPADHSGIVSTAPPLPVPAIAAMDRADRPRLHLAVSTLDQWGRVADRSTLRSLSWTPGHPVAFETCRSGLVIVRGSASGSSYQVDSRGYLRLPAEFRHGARIELDDRLLLAASEQPRLLLVYPPDLACRALWDAATDTPGRLW